MREMPILREGGVQAAPTHAFTLSDGSAARTVPAPEPLLRRPPVQRLLSAMTSALPVVIIGGLLYAGFFVKPQVSTVGVQPPVIEKRDRFYGLATPTDEVVWAAGNHGKIVLSQDAGKSWTPQPTGVDVHLQSIASWDAQRAVAVGNGGVVIVTADGGLTWSKASMPDGVGGTKLLRVRAFAAGKAWAVGEMGTVLATHDYGANWTVGSAAEDVAWNDVYFVGDTGWIVGEFGRMRVTRDGGAHWQPVEAPVGSSLSAVGFRNEREGVAVGTEGLIVATRDGGANWQILPKVTGEHLYDVRWDGTRWVAVGDKGTLLASDDTGRWTELSGAIGNSAWHTQIVGSNGRYVLAGVGLKILDIPAASGNSTEAKK